MSNAQELLSSKATNFLQYLENVRGYADTTIVTYNIALQQMLKVSHFHEEESTWILDITPFRFSISNNQKKTIMKKLSAIRSFVKYLEEQNHLHIKLIGNETIKVPKTLPKPVEESYIQEVLAGATLKEQVIITMLYGLGIRISELSNIRLEDIKSKWIQVTGKGNKVRELPIIEEVNALVIRYINDTNPNKYLFEKDRKAMSSSQLRYIISKCFKNSGLKVTPHQLRHSFATHLLNNGARISDVSELLGHETMATTQIYTKLGSSRKLQEYMKAHPLANS